MARPRGGNNVQNLTTMRERTPEERSEIGRKGGIASGESKRRKKNIRELAKVLLDKDISKSQKFMRKRMQALGFADEDMIYSNAILAAMLVKASNGDVNAAKFVRDTAGFVPEESVSVNAEVSEKSDVQIYLPELEKDDEDGESESDGTDIDDTDADVE